MELHFRNIRADEIDCRISTINGKGLSLLLYKDARCDMKILDETVGALNWERHHSRDNANCIVSIFDKDKSHWVSKEDTGTESFTDREKGLASDSFKRACFNWGIGRELYSAPFIWIDKELCNITYSDGKFKCFDRFKVSSISITDGTITYLEIKLKDKVVFSFGNKTNNFKSAYAVTDEEVEALRSAIISAGKNEKALLENAKVSRWEDLGKKKYNELMKWLKASV